MFSASKALVALLGLTAAVFVGGSCADTSEVMVQKLDKLPSSNGCSKPPGISVGGEEDFTYCCDRHDACYSTCGMSKQFCEKDFGQCMTKLCHTVFKRNEKCPGAAQVYQMGTTMFGGSGFNDLQDEYCECIPKSQVSNHYTKLLTNVYEKHASAKSAEEIPGVVENLITKVGPKVPSLAKLFYKILKKYDSAIVHEGPRRGKRPPRPKEEL